MSKDDWITVGEYPNSSCAQIASALLTESSVPHRIWPNTRPAPMASKPYLIYVAPELGDRAREVLADSSISEDELAALALASPPPEDA